MEKLQIFYLKHCPYCKNAIKALEELQKENPNYKSINIEWIEENENSELANKYDYYRVPSIFLGNKKLYECNPSHDYITIKNNLENILKTML